MEVTAYGPLRGAIGSRTVTVPFEGGTVHTALEAIVTAHPRAERYLFRDDGSVEPSVRIAVEGRSASLDDHCPADATVSVHPAMQGG